MSRAVTSSGPKLDRTVTVTIPGLEEVPATVVRRGEDFTELKLQTRTQTPLQTLQHTQVFLEFVTDDGMWRMLGTLSLHACEDGEALRFDHTGRTQLLQRRAHVRTDCIAMVVVTPAGGGPQKAMTLNISGGGLLLRGLRDAPVDTELAFDLRLDLLPARIQGRCRVVRVTPDGLHGVQFSEIEESERDKIMRFAYQREKAARVARFGY